MSYLPGSVPTSVPTSQPDEDPRTADHDSCENPWIDAIVKRALRDGLALRQELLESEKREAIIGAAATLLLSALSQGGKLLLCGNGGSAADCQHIAAELTGRFSKSPRRGLPALALTTDTSALTAIGNDYGYDEVFARQVEALGRPGDVLLCISTSGKSRNVVRAAERARAQAMSVIALCGPQAEALGMLADACILVPGSTPDRIQELHITVGHILCEVIDRAFIAALPGHAGAL